MLIIFELWHYWQVYLAVKDRKSDMRIFVENSHTAYIQRFKLFTQLFERLIFVLVEEEIFFCGIVGPDV